MIQNFDIFGQAEIPNITLCNPNKEELFSLGLAYDTKLSYKYNALSEFTFKYPQSIDGGITTLEAYGYLKAKRLVLIENFGYFIIGNVTENTDGKVPVKEVSCVMAEGELIAKKLTAFGGQYKFYDPINTGNTLMGKIMAYIPSWRIEYIDSVLWPKQRSFDVKDSTIYSFLMNEVETAFGCIFTFDTYNKTISAYAVDASTKATDIYLSYDNLLKTGKFDEISDEITTCLYVYGGGDLDIRTVNPLGTVKMYNFTYYKTLDWMSQDLIDALNHWENLVQANQVGYANLLSDLKTKNAELITLNGELVSAQEQMDSIVGVQKARIEAGQSYADLNTQILYAQLLINTKTASITQKQSEIANIENNMLMIHSLLSFENNFTSDQLSELNNFIYENTYQNNNVIQTDKMTPVEIQEWGQYLYDQGKEVLSRISVPRYEFTTETANFTVMEEFEKFTSQLELGSIITIEIREDFIIEAALLQIDINFNKPDDFTLTFSNRLRLDNGTFKFTDLFGQVQKTSTNVSFNALSWGNFDANYKDDVSNFISSALDASRNEIINSTNQEIIIDQNGLRGRTVVDPNAATKTYKNNQVWLTSNTLAFTNDAWNSAKLALGQITVNGVKQFGLVADVIVGKLLAGNQLTITNVDPNYPNRTSTFNMDGNGAVFNNANLTVKGTTTAIAISPNSQVVNGITVNPGIAILGYQNNAWKQVFYVDASGNLQINGTGTFGGIVTATGGKIGGIVINPPGLPEGIYANSNQYYLKSNGDMKWGNFIVSGGVSTFDGTFNANKIVGQIINTQIADNAITSSKIANVSAGSVTSGTMYGDRISGGTINGVTLSWPGGSISNGGGYANFNADQNVTFNVGGSNPLTLAGNYVKLNGIVEVKGGTLSCTSSASFSGGTTISNALNLSGVSSIATGSGNGLTTSIDLSGIAGYSNNRRLWFRNGILYSAPNI